MNWKWTYVGEIVEIPVNDLSGCEDCSNLYEVVHTDFCLANHSWLNGVIVLEIPWSSVTNVVFKMESQNSLQPLFSWLESRLSGYEPRMFAVSVCKKGNTCTFCGTVIHEEKGLAPVPRRENIPCGNGIEGNQVLVTQRNNSKDFSQPCGLTVLGKSKTLK